MMKIYNKLIAGVFMLTLLFTSCSKDENNVNATGDSETAILSFGTILHDFNNTRSQQKDHLNDFPVCSEAAPAYVRVEITGDGYSGPASLDIPLTDTPGDYDDDGEAEYFTLEDENLELPAGVYTLQQFTVYDENDNLIWVAPTTEGSLGAYVDSPLPKIINLAAGTKKYVDVEVLCYDKRMVNEYGYLFFELETNVALDFCFFANYCDENGRHFTAAYEVDIWYGTDDSGTVLYSNVGPTPSQYEESGEYYTEPVCFALPALPEGLDEDEPYIYFEATLSDWAGNYGDVDPLMISGTLSYSDIIANFDGNDNVDYRHLRFGCGDNGGEVGCDLDDPEADCDGDGVLNGVDCDPDDASIKTTNANDADCDGVPTADDCDDNDPSVGAASTTFYADTDGDGLGDRNDSVIACTQPEGYVDNDSDQCPGINPETDTNGDGCEDTVECDLDDPIADCDGDGTPNGEDCDPDNAANSNSNVNDADCDGIPTADDCDDNDPSVGAASTTYYADTDGDGLGDPNDSVVACTQPDGFVSNSNDPCPDDSSNTCNEPTACNLTIPATPTGCLRAIVQGQTADSWLEIDQNTGVPLVDANEDAIIDVATWGIEIVSGDIVYTFDSGSANVTNYLIEIRNPDTGDVVCVDESDTNNIIEGSFSYPIEIRVTANVCPTN